MKELFYSNYNIINKDILTKVFTGIETILATNKKNKLNLDIAKQICGLNSQIDSSLCQNGTPVNFPTEQDVQTVIATFYDNTELTS